MTRATPSHTPSVLSLLDTDLYKLTMQCAVLKHFPDSFVTHSFTNRTSDMLFTRAAFDWLKFQINKLADVRLSAAELDYLHKQCPYLNDTYLSFLSHFRFRPSEQIDISFVPVDAATAGEKTGELGLIALLTHGKWVDTILYEIPLLALTSEAYFSFCDRDWDHAGQEAKAYDKATVLLENGCFFSDFGSRRRRDYHTQDLVIRGLCRAAQNAGERGLPGRFAGTSNVHFAMKYGVTPIGTAAHEWIMGIAAITGDYENADELGLRYWLDCFGEGVLGIALTDTFGTPSFLQAFGKAAPAKSLSTSTTRQDSQAHPQPTYAHVYTGVRQDSGDPKEYVRMLRHFYDSLGIGRKQIVFSDSLNVDLCLEYKKIAEEAGFTPSFGVGTFLTNDFETLSTSQKSPPLNIVIKLSSADGRPAVKLSDNLGKNTGDSQTVKEVKQRLGYVEREWEKGDETRRWASPAAATATTESVSNRNGNGNGNGK